MSKGKRKFVFLSDQESAAYLLELQKDLKGRELLDLSVEQIKAKNRETLKIIKWFENDLDIKDAKGTLSSRIDDLIERFCFSFSLSRDELEGQLEPQIEQGIVPSTMGELQEGLLSHQETVEEINGIVSQRVQNLVKAPTFSSAFLTRILRRGTTTLLAEQSLGLRGDDSVTRACAQAARSLAQKELARLNSENALPLTVEELLKDSVLGEAIKEIPSSSQATFLSDLTKSLPELATQVAVGFGVEKEIQRAAQQLARAQGIPLDQARKIVRDLSLTQSAVLKEQVLATSSPGQKAAEERLSLVAAKIAARAVIEQSEDPEITSGDLAKKIAEQSEVIAREVGRSTGIGGQQALKEAIEDRSEVSGGWISQALEQQVSLQETAVALQGKYNLSPAQAQRVVGAAKSKMEEVLIEATKGVVNPRLLRGAVSISAGFATSAALQGASDDPRKTPLGQKAELRKKISILLRQARVPSHKIKQLMPRLESFLPADLHRIRFEANKEIIYAALEKAVRRAGLPIERQKVPISSVAAKGVVYQQPRPQVEINPRSVGVELIQLVTELADPNLDLTQKEEISPLAVIISHRLGVVTPEITPDYIEKVLEDALLIGEEKEGAQSALLRISFDHPYAEEEFLADERRVLYLQQLEESLGIELAPEERFVADFLLKTQIGASLYQVSVSSEHIPPSALALIKDSLGEKVTYTYQEALGVLGNQLSPEQIEALWPLIDDQGNLTFRGALEIMQDSKVRGVGVLSEFSGWYEGLGEESKQRWGWLKGVLDQKNSIVSAVANNPIYKLRQRFFQARANFLRPIGDWAIRTVTFGRVPTMAAGKTAVANWFFKTSVGSAIQTGVRTVATKVAAWAAKETAKKVIGSAAAKALAAGATLVVGISTAGLATLIQVAVMVAVKVVKKLGQLGKRLLDTLGIDSVKLEVKLREAFGFLGVIGAKMVFLTVGIVDAIVKTPINIGKVVLIAFLAALGAVIVPAVLIITILGSGQRIAMEGRGSSPVDFEAVLDDAELAALDQGQLPLQMQLALEKCKILRVAASNLPSVETCLAGAGFSQTAIETVKYSAQEHDYLQCVAFVVATVPDFPGGGNAHTFVDSPPSGWRSRIDNGAAQVGDLAVWGPGESCGGQSCSSNVDCCGHIGVVTGVRQTPEMSYLTITQANGANGKVVTTEVATTAPTTILTSD